MALIDRPRSAALQELDGIRVADRDEDAAAMAPVRQRTNRRLRADYRDAGVRLEAVTLEFQ